MDNEKAVNFLRLDVGQNHPHIEWVAIRPDGPISEAQISPYELTHSPLRNVIFDAGTTSHINVADFMSELAANSNLWDEWIGKMPVIYNQA